ncbi:MAG TPA: hypothetical protein VI277_04430 [Candidatus Limnocylindria bacterium]
MTIARRVERTPHFPTYTISRIAAVVAAVLAAGILAVAAIELFDLQQPVNRPTVLVLEAEGRWELQQALISGTLDPSRQAEREWERQHRQLTFALY